MPLARYVGNGRENSPTPATQTLRNPPQAGNSFGIDPKLTAKMTLVDLVIIVLVLLMALQGFARGFLVGATALAGFIAGAYIGIGTWSHEVTVCPQKRSPKSSLSR